LRLSLVNDSDNTVYFDDFEITHQSGDEKLSVTSWTDYYPFGKVAKTSCPSNGGYRYGYQGEFAEKDSETDWNSFELRQYDSEIGRFTTTDPMGEFWSSYVGMGNDPVNLTDPTGGCTDCKKTDPVYNGGTLPEVVVTPESNYIANNPILYNQIADFNKAHIAAPKLSDAQIQTWVSKQPKSTGAITPSYPEEFLMPDVPLIWIAGKLGKGLVQTGIKTVTKGFGGFLKHKKVSDFVLTHSEGLITSKRGYQDIKNLSDNDLIQSVMNPNNGERIIINS
jgi:RHS repeat-associated protein